MRILIISWSCALRGSKFLVTFSSSLFFILFFCQTYPGLRNCKSVFLIFKILQYGGSRRWVQLSARHPCKNWYQNWYLHFYKIYGYQIWLAGTSKGFDASDTNESGASDVITSRSIDKLKSLYLRYHCAYGQQTWQDGNLPWWAPSYKITWSFDHVALRDQVAN